MLYGHYAGNNKSFPDFVQKEKRLNHQFTQNKADEYYTKEYAILPLLEYVDKNNIVWCPFDKPESSYVKILTTNGNNVIHSHIDNGQDFFSYTPDYFDVVISNPPYSKREAILERLFSFKKPFAMLINEAGLFDSKKRFNLLRNNTFEIMVFSKRIDYIKNDSVLSGVPFKSIYLCHNFLPDRFIFKDV